MSLGLDDLKKRNLAHNSAAKSSTAKPEKSINDLRQSIKPWSTRGLAKLGVSRKQTIGVDFHINEDWIEIQGQSFFWLNLNFSFDHLHEETDLRFQRKLSAFEKKFSSSFDKVKNFVSFFGLSSTPTT